MDCKKQNIYWEQAYSSIKTPHRSSHCSCCNFYLKNYGGGFKKTQKNRSCKKHLQSDDGTQFHLEMHQGLFSGAGD